MASFIDQGANFQGSEIVLIDLDEQRLRVVRTIAEKVGPRPRNRSQDLLYDRPPYWADRL
jgi:6-phospho-beta-glucosidase